MKQIRDKATGELFSYTRRNIIAASLTSMKIKIKERFFRVPLDAEFVEQGEDE